ncbi:MAG TPA: TolC family protein [Flavisolibacter sp.]|nr:TolC family protein [Flavisolibacter sp.]
MKNLRLLLGAVLLLSVGVSSAQNRYELTVKEAVDLAFKNVNQLKNAQLDYKIQEAQNKEITGQALPQISGTAGAQYYFQLPRFLFPDASETGIYNVLIKEGLLPSGTKIPVPVMQQVSFQQPWNLSVGATLTQLLFQPDVFVGLQARKAALNLSASAIDVAKEAIRDSAYKRYYAILIAQKQLDFLDSSLVRLQKLYHDDSIMYKNGFAEHLDLDKVQVQLNNVQTSRTLVKNVLDVSYAALKFAIGVSQKDTVVLTEELTNQSVKDGVLDDSFKYEDRAAIRSLEYAKQLRSLDVKRNKLSVLPTVALAGNYSLSAMGPNFFTDANTTWFKSAYAGLNVNIPIFSGFQRKYKLAQAELTLQKSENDISNVKQAIDFEQVVNKDLLSNSLLSLDVQERNLQLAQRVYNSTKLKFEQGVGSSFEVLQSDTEYQTAQSNYFNALYNAVIAKISYLSALGKLQ